MTPADDLAAEELAALAIDEPNEFGNGPMDETGFDMAATLWFGRKRQPTTDMGNAMRFALDHRDAARYVPGIGWHVWDGQRWAADVDGAAERLAKDSIRKIKQEASELDDEASDDDERKRAQQRFAWAQASQSRPRLESMVRLAQTERKLIAHVADLDADPWVLNVLNGTVDLRTGELRPHDPAALITRLAGARYEAGARSERWERFLRDATGDDDELARYLQRGVGYTLTGSTEEEVLFFAHGPTATGKSTLLEALAAVLGEYALAAAFGTFLERRDHAPRNDIAELRGARLVTSSEVTGGAKFDAQTIKHLTGGDTVPARFLYRETFRFRPAFKLWFGANDRPAIEHDDGAMWRRVHTIPFVRVVAEERRDSSVKEALRSDPDDLAAILAWAVEGSLAWQREKLRPPKKVLDYTAEYRNDQDPLRDWFAEHVVIDADGWVSRSDVRSSYRGWCHRNDVEAVDARKLVAALRARKVKEKGKGGVRGWRLKLSLEPEAKPEPDDVEAAA
jgi:putative DNA primase/helicase